MTLAIDLPLAAALVASLGANARQVMVARTRNARPKPPPPSATAEVFDPFSGHTLTVTDGRVTATTAQPNNDPEPT